MRRLRNVSSLLTVVAAFTSACASSPGATPPSTRGVITSADHDSNEPIERVLQRKAPGVNVTRSPDGSLAMQIRGSSSYRGNETPPLFIVNGSHFRSGPKGELAGIDPYEIDTIKVLTPAESGIYGIDGANGVILITTRRGGKREP